MKYIKPSLEGFRIDPPTPKPRELPTSKPRDPPPRTHHEPPHQEHLKTYLRVKPLPHPPPSTPPALRITSPREVEILPPYFSSETERVYQYEEVFGEQAGNQEVFERAMLQPIDNALSGYNSTVFIYGMTGAGKTYTMFNTLPDDVGLVSLTLTRLFHQIAALPDCQYHVSLSFYEIYNENIRDLLSDNSQPLTILEDPVKGVFINDLKEFRIEGEEQAQMEIKQGMTKRAMNATKNNEVSSRSHAILQFNIKRYTQHKEGNDYSMSESKLFMIDLAGNQKAGQNQTKRFVEGVNINKSLLTLGKCISILSEQKKPVFIPFRDSKLTRILKDSLGGNSKTVMIACVTSETRFYEETLNTLKYSSKAKHIKSAAKTSTKTIPKHQLPPHLLHPPPPPADGLTLQEEESIYEFVNRMESIVREKARAETVREEVEVCLYEAQREVKEGRSSEACRQHLKELGSIIPQLNEKYNSILSSLEEEIKKFVTNISDMAKNKKQKEEESMNLKRQIKKQQQIIEQLENKLIKHNHKYVESINSEPRVEKKYQHPLSTIKIQPSSLSHLPNNNIFIDSASIKKQAYKNHNLISININSCKFPNNNISKCSYSNKENISQNATKRATTPQAKDIKYEKDVTSKYKKALITVQATNTIETHPTIETTPNDIKPPPNMQHHLSAPFQSLNNTNSTNQKKEQFTNRLKQMDKNTQSFSKEMISELLAQFERQSYDIDKVERSMLNKLRFMLKSRDSFTSSLLRSQKQKKVVRDKSLIKL